MLFRPDCPVDADMRGWVDEQLRWLTGQFGDAVLNGPVVVPTEQYFPGTYTGVDAEVEPLVHRLAAHMGIDASILDVEIFETAADHARKTMPFLQSGGSTVAGDWQQRDGRGLIGIDRAYLQSPRLLVATIGHELAHQRLLGERRIAADRRDGEQLTDLATVFFGLGIFNANAVREFSATILGSWRAARLGYLDERIFGYALARYARLRTEPKPAWAQYLDTNPRTYMRRSMRYLAAHPG